MDKALIIIGLVMEYTSNLFWDFSSYILATFGLGLVLWGCCLWAKRKNRHWAFMFWGIIAPIGLLGISLLKNRNIGDRIQEAEKTRNG